MARVLADGVPLHHVVAHGVVRYRNNHRGNDHDHGHDDETYSLDSRRRLLDMNEEEFRNASGQLASLHFSAARALLPRLEGLSESMGEDTSYTFVTGDGSGHPSSSARSAVGDLNAYHVWGLSEALRSELKGQSSKVVCREIRVGIPVNRPKEERLRDPRARKKPISGDIGDLCAGLLCSGGEMDGGLLEMNSEERLEAYLQKFEVIGTGTGTGTEGKEANEPQLQSIPS